MQHVIRSLSAAALVFGLFACGADPGFISSGGGSGGGGGGAALDQIEAGKGTVTATATGTETMTTTSTETGTDTAQDDEVTFDGLSEHDEAALRKCLGQWKNHPFKGETDVRRIFAAVTVGGTGNAINDTEQTDAPQLVLVDAGVNVLGSPTYQLLNANGWYCLKVNVNVMTALTVNLHCDAHLGDQRLSVNVGSSQTGATSAVGVHVLSDVKVKETTETGAACTP